MEEALRIFDYLPYSYKDQNELDYIINLKETFELNYNDGKYHFAFIAYHMLYMSYVYFEIWQIREVRRDDFDKGMIGFNIEDENFTKRTDSRPFSLFRINESGVFRFFRLLGCADDEIGNFKKIVKHRNEAAHVNGSRQFATQTFLDTIINDILRHVEKIQSLTFPIIEASFEKFLSESWNSDEREYAVEDDEIKENLIHRHYLSWEDMKQLTRFDINRLSSHPNFTEVNALFEKFKEIYSQD